MAHGRLILDEATDLPDGTEVGLAVIESPDALDDEDRARLHRALARGVAELERGEGISDDELLEELHGDS